MNSTSFLLCSDHRLFRFLIIPNFFLQILSLAIACVVWCGAKWSREKSECLICWIFDPWHWQSFLYFLWSISLSRDQSPPYVSYHIQNEKSLNMFSLLPLICFSGFHSYYVYLERLSSRLYLPWHTFLAFLLPVGNIGDQKKSLLENNIEWNGFIFVLRSNVCAYLHCVVIIVLFSLFFYNDVLSCLSYNIDTGERMISPSLLCVDGRRREWADVMTSEPTVSFTKYKKNKKRRFKNNNKKNSFPLSWSFCVGGRFAFARLIAGFSVTIGVSCHLGSSVGRH